MGSDSHHEVTGENDFSDVEMRRVARAVDPHDATDVAAIMAAKKLGSAPSAPHDDDYFDDEDEQEQDSADEKSWLKSNRFYVPRVTRFDDRRRCCCCLGSLVSERTALAILAALLTLLVLVLVILMLVSGGIVMPWLHAHSDDVFVYGSLEPQVGGTYPPDAQVLYNSCAWPTVPFDGSLGTPPPPYLDPDTCASGTGGSCCPVGYLRNVPNTPKAKVIQYCASSEQRCPSDFAVVNCVAIIANKSRTVTDVPYRGLLVQLNVSSADWSWALLFLLTPLAVLLLLAELSFCLWQALSSRSVAVALLPDLVLADPTSPTPAEREMVAELQLLSRSDADRFNHGCLGAMAIGCLMAALLLTGGLSGIFASSPDIDDANSIAECFVNPTPQTKALLDPLTTWYTVLVLSTSFASLMYVFTLMAHLAYVLPQLYNRFWRWDMWFYIMLLTSVILMISLLSALIQTW